MYYVNDNACDTLEDAEEVALLYRIAGVSANILTEGEYFAQKHWASINSVMSAAYEFKSWD
jgi:hypothetical protein